MSAGHQDGAHVGLPEAEDLLSGAEVVLAIGRVFLRLHTSCVAERGGYATRKSFRQASSTLLSAGAHPQPDLRLTSLITRVNKDLMCVKE
jgi:hypothetical protein